MKLKLEGALTVFFVILQVSDCPFLPGIGLNRAKIKPTHLRYLAQNYSKTGVGLADIGV